MLSLYSYENDKLIIHDPFCELWSIMKCKGKYILPPEPPNNIIANVPDKIKIVGCLSSDKYFYFNESSEISLPINYDYEIKWKITSKHKHNIGFYSPYRKFNSNRLYLNYDKYSKKLTKFDYKSGKMLINCNILIVKLDKICKFNDNTTITLTINPIIKSDMTISNPKLMIDYCKIQIFDINKEGIFYRPIIKQEFKELYSLVRKHYESTSIKRKFTISNNINNYLRAFQLDNIKDLPKVVDYNNVLSKSSYQSIYSVTTEIKPIDDRVGYYGIVIKHDQKIISSATIIYEFKLSENILQTPDIIVMAAFYEGNKGYALHQIYDKINKKEVYVMNIHDGPYPKNNNLISGKLQLESTAADITLILGNSLFGILPTNGENPNNIIKFTKFEIQYENVER